MVKVRTINPRRIYDARLRSGMVQEDIAHALRRQGFKTTAKSVSQWERGINAPRSEVIPTLADVLGVSIDDIYGADDEEDDHMSTFDLGRALLSAVETLVDRKLAEARRVA